MANLKHQEILMQRTLKMSVIIVTLFLSAAVRLCAEAETNKWPSITLSSAVANKYLQPGTGDTVHNRPVVQTDLLVTFKNGLYLDLWNSRSLQGKWDDGSLGNEVDYGLGWDGTVEGLTAHIGFVYYDEPKAFTLGAGDIFYTELRLGKEFKWLSVTAGYQSYTTMPDSGFQGGHLVSLGVSRTQSLYGDKVSLNASFAGVYDTGTLGTLAGFMFRGNAGINWNINKHFTLNAVSVNYYVPLTRRLADAMVMSGLTYRF